MWKLHDNDKISIREIVCTKFTSNHHGKWNGKTAKEIDDLVSEIIMYMNSHNKAGWNSNNSLFTLSIFSILGCSIILLVSFRVGINNSDHNQITSAHKSLFENEHWYNHIFPQLFSHRVMRFHCSYIRKRNTIDV